MFAMLLCVSVRSPCYAAVFVFINSALNIRFNVLSNAMLSLVWLMFVLQILPSDGDWIRGTGGLSLTLKDSI